jgi:gliding motility-associated-like protein
VDFATIDGCPASDSVVVRVTVPEDELRFEPVTFLSPNGDGQNDELYFPGLESYKSNDLNIYSRWGQLIFSKIDYQISGALWDGTLRGQPLPAGVYYYILRVDEQNITVKRNLTIVY